MAKYKSHKQALIGVIKELEKRGFESTKSVDEMTPDECEEFILNSFDEAIYRKDCLITSLRAKVEKNESAKREFVSPNQTYKTFMEKLKYILSK